MKKEIESLWVNSSSSLVLDRWYKKLHFLRKLVLHFYQKWSLLSFRIFYSGRMSRFFLVNLENKSDTLTKSKIEFSNFPKWMRRKAVWPTLSIDFKAQQSWQHWIEIKIFNIYNACIGTSCFIYFFGFCWFFFCQFVMSYNNNGIMWWSDCWVVVGAFFLVYLREARQ